MVTIRCPACGLNWKASKAPEPRNYINEYCPACSADVEPVDEADEIETRVESPNDPTWNDIRRQVRKPQR